MWGPKPFTSLLAFSLLLISSLFVARSTHSAERYQEISPLAVFYSGDAMRSPTLIGVSYLFHFNRAYWVGVDVFGLQTSVDSASGLNVRDSRKFLAIDGAIYFNLPVLMGAKDTTEKNFLQADLYTAIGGGHLWLDQSKTAFAFIGGGLLIHLGLDWLAIRFDLKNLFYSLENSGGENFNSDMALSLGPSLKWNL